MSINHYPLDDSGSCMIAFDTLLPTFCNLILQELEQSSQENAWRSVGSRKCSTLPAFVSFHFETFKNGVWLTNHVLTHPLYIFLMRHCDMEGCSAVQCSGIVGQGKMCPAYSSVQMVRFIFHSSSAMCAAARTFLFLSPQAHQTDLHYHIP